MTDDMERLRADDAMIEALRSRAPIPHGKLLVAMLEAYRDFCSEGLDDATGVRTDSGTVGSECGSGVDPATDGAG